MTGEQRTAAKNLAHYLAGISRAEQEKDYTTRNALVLHAFTAALAAGYEAGWRCDPQEPEWPVVYLELPTGQVSWHLPQHPRAWDGHTTEQKYERCRAYVEQA